MDYAFAYHRRRFMEATAPVAVGGCYRYNNNKAALDFPGAGKAEPSFGSIVLHVGVIGNSREIRGRARRCDRGRRLQPSHFTGLPAREGATGRKIRKSEDLPGKHQSIPAATNASGRSCGEE